MEFTYQFYTGGFNGRAADSKADEVLKNIFEQTGPGDVIIGWRPEEKCYRRLLDRVHGSGKKIWLWLPVFAELPEDKKPEPAISYKQKALDGLCLLPGEDFRFVCPSSWHNQDITYDLYNKKFSHLPFDGVFLDKIRHASFAGGPENGFGCFCGNCIADLKRQGVDTMGIIHKINTEPGVFMPESVENGRYHFKDENVDAFYRAKADRITESLRYIIGLFRKDGLQIGLDVFAPLLAYWVGQDISALTEQADFIKPMVYRITHAPAGLPYEVKWLMDSFLPFGGNIVDELKRIWETDDLYSDTCLEKQLKTMDISVTRPGFEVNIVPEICESSPGYVSSTVKVLREMGFLNAVLSWNLLGETGENLGIIG